MIDRLKSIVRGAWLWRQLRHRYRLDDEAAVLVLSECYDEWNRTALAYYPDYLTRKGIQRAVVLYRDPQLPNKMLEAFIAQEQKKERFVIGIPYPSEQMDALLAYYCLHKFSDNIVLLYRQKPQENKTELVLAQGTVTMAEWIALGFFHLRQVPHHV